MNRLEMEAGSSDPASVMRDLRAELMAVEPSPAFAAGVRARVEPQSSRSPFPRFALAAAAVMAVAGGAYWLAPRERVLETATSPVASAVAVAPTLPGPSGGPTPAVRQASARRTAGSVSANAAPTLTTGPDLTVITDQPAAIRRLWAVADVTRRGLPPDQVTEITVAPVVVNPIVIPLLGDAGRGGLAPGVRRLTGESGAVNAESAPRSER